MISSAFTARTYTDTTILPSYRFNRLGVLQTLFDERIRCGELVDNATVSGRGVSCGVGVGG